MDKKFCPNCGSTHVEPDTSNQWATAVFGGNPNMWKCRECDYSGIMPSGNPEEEFEEGSDDIDFEPDEEYNRVDLEATPKFIFWWIVFSVSLGAVYAVYLSL
jgi:hypothetical protein